MTVLGATQRADVMQQEERRHIARVIYCWRGPGVWMISFDTEQNAMSTLLPSTTGAVDAVAHLTHEYPRTHLAVVAPPPACCPSTDL